MRFEFHLPDIGEGVVEGEIVEWKVAEGDAVALDQPLVDIMTDKATVEIPSPRAGRIAEIKFAAGDTCPVGEILVVIDTDAAATTAPGAGAAPAPGNGHRRVKATPATRRLARSLGVELTVVPPTGKRGRVTSEDVRRVADAGTALAVREQPTGLEERIPFRGVRRRIAENMVRSKFTATHFTYVEEVDATELVALRERTKQGALERGIKLTFLPFIIKAIVAGLKKWPQLNATLDEDAGEIVLKHYYHIGVAAQGPRGLVVSVVRNADRLSIYQIAAEIERLSEAVESGSATREELTGSTFSISSLGKIGGVLATPIINYPEVGIVGVHKIEQRPAVRDGQIVARWLTNLSISLDHRVVDGWDGAMFLQEVKALLEDPTRMFMDMA